MTDVRALSPDRFELGEGSRWVGDRVVLVDIPAGRLFGTPTPTGSGPQTLTLLAELDVPLAAVAPVRDAPGTWLAAAGTGFWLLEPTGARQLAAAEPVTGRQWRMNDAAADPAGRLWAGSMACDQSPKGGALYRLDPDGKVHTVLTGLTIANGPALTADGRTMFLSDTPLGLVQRFDVDPATGELSGRREFVRLGPDEGSPDGLTVDADGFLWVACFGGGAVRRYRPDGQLDRVVPVPARQPTSVCLAGSRLVVTSGRGGLEQPGPDDGAVLVTDAPAQGLPALAVSRPAS
ncbi:SMP-30/gluconolactonase/LRE family protein [Actinoplanes auranticolor]|uniref:Calcium-binding protein n=1 Tax=Actinoplanes auranticolor TaxID=47988 RepID=A0A919SDW6_9ACTN|nr:SMP-30/gluconolactonase/LRE family protein [Actinoplanes auranticolor]GIM69869.1 calcium-binding protein [Actinoplanes auranticolor]